MPEYNTCKKHFRYILGYFEHCAVPAESIPGYKNRKVRKIYDLFHHPKAHCWILETDKEIYLQSYSTIVACFYKKSHRFEDFNMGGHSKTTSRQIRWFENELVYRFGSIIHPVKK